MFRNKFTSKLLVFLKAWYIFIVLACIYIPLIVIVLLSFNPATEKNNVNLNFGVPSFVNYLNLWTDDTFINALLNTLLLSIIVVPISIIFGIMTCYGLWKARLTTKSIFLNASRLSIINPEAITGISLLLLFSSTIIPLGVNLGFFTVVLAHISFCTPYAIITIYPRILKMNPNLVLASYDLGNGKMRTLFKVVLPYLWPSILSAIVIVFSMSWDDFIITNLVNGSFQTIGTAIYMTRKGIKAWVVTFGAIMVIITLVITVGIFVSKTIKEKNLLKRRISNETKIA